MAKKAGFAVDVANRVHKASPSVAVHVGGGIGVSLQPTAEVQQSKSARTSHKSDVLLTTKRGVPLVSLAVRDGKVSPADTLAIAHHAAQLRLLYPHLSYGLVIGHASVLPAELKPTDVTFAIALGASNSDWTPLLSLAKRQTKICVAALKRNKRQRTIKRLETVVKVR